MLVALLLVTEDGLGLNHHNDAAEANSRNLRNYWNLLIIALFLFNAHLDSSDFDFSHSCYEGFHQ